MPKGQNPRQGALAKMGALETQLKNATTQTKLQKVKSLFKAYTTGYTGEKEPANVKAMRRKIAMRQQALLKNANKMDTKQVP
jgi:hypothetical protein